jgi:soluble lytic murein transglycosylase
MKLPVVTPCCLRATPVRPTRQFLRPLPRLHLIIAAWLVLVWAIAMPGLAAEVPGSGTPDRVFAEGKRHYDAANLQKAQESWTALFADPLYGPVSLLLLGRANLEKGHPDRAETLLRTFNERYGNSVYRDEATEILIEALIQQHKPEARTLLTTVLAKSPESEKPSLLLKLADLERRLGNYPAAVTHYRKLLVGYPASVQGLKASEDVAWMVVHGKTARLMLSEDEQQSRAVRLFAKGRFDLAEEAYRTLLKAKPNDTNLMFKIAQCRFKGRRNEEALVSLKELLKKDLHKDRRSEALHLLALVNWRMDKDKEFDQACAKLLETGTPVFKRKALFNLGAFNLEKGHLDKAQQYFSRYLQSGPDQSSRAQVKFKLAWIDYLGGRYPQAADAFRDARGSSASGGLDNASKYWQGRALALAKRGKEAEPLFRELASQAAFDYYGLLAANRLKALNAEEPAAKKADHPFPSTTLNANHRANRLVAAAEKLLEAGVPDFALRNLKALPQVLRVSPPIAYLTARAAYAAEQYDEAYNILCAQFGAFVQNPSPSTPSEFLETAYPRVMFKEAVTLGRKHGVDPHLIWAIMRQESRYDPEIVSPAGALGLMQVTPGAAGISSNRARVSSQMIADILEPKKNLHYGVRELGKNLKTFKGKVIPSVAAYNADIRKVRAWVRSNGHLKEDEFVEMIPYLETRLYVKKVMAGYRAYAKVYRQKDLAGFW